MNEERAREIHSGALWPLSQKECTEADQWVKDYALRKLNHYLRSASVPHAAKQYIRMMCLYTYGSAETDHFLWEIKAYPHWLMVKEHV